MLPHARRPAFPELVTLALSLVGFLGLISVVREMKLGVLGVSRNLYLPFLMLTCAPFALAFRRPPKPLYLVPPVVAIFLLYPIMAPYGVVYGPDPIFNYAFSNSIVTSGFWVPGRTASFDFAYSYYPIGNTFIGYVTRAATVPGDVAFLWIEPVTRLLAMPAAVYAIARRRFSARVAALSVLLYMGTASILFNTPVQQGMGVLFFALALLALLMLDWSPDRAHQRRVVVLFALASGALIMTHHMTSYIFVGWIAAAAVLMSRQRSGTNVSPMYWGLIALFIIDLLSLYITAFTYPVFQIHEASAESAINAVLASETVLTAGGAAPQLGRTFSTLDAAWIAGSILGLLGLGLLGVLAVRRSHTMPFAVANGLTGAGLMLGTLPLLATGLRDVPLRVGEYANLFLAPFAAVTLLRWAQRGLPQSQDRPRRTASVGHVLRAAGAVTIVSLLFMGGTMVAGVNRPYFEAPSTWSTDSPLVVGADAQQAAAWASDHLGTARFWGDQLAVDTFAGFAHMRTGYGSSYVFANSTLNATVWSQLAPGDYVVVDRWMAVYAPHFLQQPEGVLPLKPADIGKFAADPHFALVFADATFSVYLVVSNPSS